MMTSHCEVFADEILADYSQNRHSAKINSPPKFPAIQYIAHMQFLCSVDMLCSFPVQVESAYFCSLIASADEYGVFVYDPEE